MNTTRDTIVTGIGVAIASAVAPAMLFLGSGTAQAIQNVTESAPGVSFGAFVPQPDPPDIIDPGLRSRHVDDPSIKGGIGDPGIKVGLGGPDTRPGR